MSELQTYGSREAWVPAPDVHGEDQEDVGGDLDHWDEDVTEQEENGVCDLYQLISWSLSTQQLGSNHSLNYLNQQRPF